MRTITCFNDLKDYGIFCLTGEACGLGMRVLCDFSEKGKNVLTKLFGFEFKGGEPWNRSTNGEAHVGCVMLTHDMVTPVGIFALLENGCTEAYTASPQTYHGEVEALRRFQEAYAKMAQYATQLEDPAGTRDPGLKARAEDLLKDVPRKSYRSFSLGTVYGREPQDEEETMQNWFRYADQCGWGLRRWAYRGTAGGRNQHVMSGRVV